MCTITGGCHCGNISYIAEFSLEPAAYNPRLCDCKYCSSHGASYSSDSKGKLTINIKKENAINKYRQGSRIVDFMICKTCGVLTNVIYEENNCSYAYTNTRSTDEYAAFGDSQIAHLMQLSDEDRIKLWRSYWFRNVKIEYESA